MDPIQQNRLAYDRLIEDFGSLEQQKDTLVRAILDTAQQPDKWPLTDTQRIEVILSWVKMAQRIDETKRRAP